jgi:hypothetical protein
MRRKNKKIYFQNLIVKPENCQNENDRLRKFLHCSALRFRLFVLPKWPG